MSRNEAFRFDAVTWLRRYGTTLFLVALVVFFGVENSRFLSLRNITNILTEVSIYGIIAVGMTFVILTAGVDLAVGSLLALAGMAGAYRWVHPVRQKGHPLTAAHGSARGVRLVHRCLS